MHAFYSKRTHPAQRDRKVREMGERSFIAHIHDFCKTFLGSPER